MLDWVSSGTLFHNWFSGIPPPYFSTLHHLLQHVLLTTPLFVPPEIYLTTPLAFDNKQQMIDNDKPRY